MKTVKTVKETRDTVSAWKKQGLTVGFVPTMGFLHDGHKSLIETSAKENDKTVVSIFVNPMQFGPSEDFDSYPRDFERDSEICKDGGADLIFAPVAEEMYEAGFSSYVNVTGVSEGLCGAARPGHFKGVCTVVNKLFNIVSPHKAYFGQKDAQQLAVIKRMTRDLNMDLEVVSCPIVREKDGLALSSRNTYLNADERKAALCLYKAVLKGQEMLAAGERDAEVITSVMRNLVSAEPKAKIDYIQLVDAGTLLPVKKAEGPVLCALAVFIGKTRLIDNFIFQP